MIDKLTQTKHVLVENDLQAFDSSYFRGWSYFLDSDDTQNYFVFQLIFRYFKRNDYVLEWRSKGLSGESVKSLSATNNIIDPLSDYLGAK